MQSLSGHNLMRQQVPTVFSLHLVYLSTAVCINVESGTQTIAPIKQTEKIRVLLVQYF